MNNDSQQTQTSPRTGKGKVGIVGAGSVGATIAYASMVQGLASQIVLSDVNVEKCEAEVKDLNHGLRFAPSVRLRSGDIEDMADADVVVVTAGAKQKPGQSRLDLAQTNVRIFEQLIPLICRSVPDAVLLIVSNPVDVLTYAAQKIRSCNPDRVFGSGTVLDTSRFCSLIAGRLNVAIRNVHGYIVGEHGDSEIPLWSCGDISAIPLADFESPGHPRLTEADKEEIIGKVRSAAGEIIKAKGATNWAIGLATARILEAILRDENAILTVSRLVSDWNGISDVCLSLPCVVSRHGAGPPLPVPMDDDELAGLRNSAEVLKQSIHEVGL